MNTHSNKQQLNFSENDEIKIGVLSDTHSCINATIFNHLRNCDLILHAGDIGSTNVIKQLEKICGNIISVRGNNDIAALWHDNELRDLDSIPKIAEIELPGGNITLTHGDECYCPNTWHEQLRKCFPNSKAIVYGHSHKLICDQSKKPWVLNPGAAGETRVKKHGISCLLINANKENWKVSECRI